MVVEIFDIIIRGRKPLWVYCLLTCNTLIQFGEEQQVGRQFRKLYDLMRFSYTKIVTDFIWVFLYTLCPLARVFTGWKNNMMELRHAGLVLRRIYMCWGKMSSKSDFKPEDEALTDLLWIEDTVRVAGNRYIQVASCHLLWRSKGEPLCSRRLPVD